MLSETELTEARRHLGYPARGADPALGSGWQFYRASGAVEFRLANLSATEEEALRHYLGTLGELEQAIPASAPGLDTGSAAGWVRNPRELDERWRLFDDWRRRFCAFLGVQPGPGLAASSVTPGLVV